MEFEDGFPNVLGIRLVVVGELRDHYVIGVKSTLHHLLTLENLLLHCFEPRLHASGRPWALNIVDVQHPLTHLNGLRVLQHLHKIGVDNPLEKLVLGSAWRCHGTLDLSEKQLETKTEDICVVRWSTPSGDYIMNFYRPKEVSCTKTESGEHTRCPRGRRRAQGDRVHPPPSCPFRTASYFSIFLNIPKRRKNAIRTVLESVYLLYHIPIPFRSLKCSGKCPLCIPPGLRFQ